MTHPTHRPVPSRLLRLRRATVATALLLTLAAGLVHAQDQGVQVYDSTTHTNTSNTANNTDKTNQLIGGTGNSNDTINGHLKNIDTLGNAPATLSTVAAPAAAVNPDTMASAPTDNSGTACNGVASAQQSMCENIIKAKFARFNYMKAMYDSTLKLQTALTNLQNARQQIGTEEFGKLQDNSNQILAIIAQLQIDRQQMESVNLAYQAYIDDQQNQQVQQAKDATAPGSNSAVTNVISNIVAGAILKTALNVESDGSGQQLGIEKSSGW